MKGSFSVTTYSVQNILGLIVKNPKRIPDGIYEMGASDRESFLA